MSFGDPWGSPFYSGGAVSSLVPSLYHLAIAGVPFMIDRRSGEGASQQADIPIQRAQADTSADPSEATLTTESLWRRTVHSWAHGGGQRNYDRPTSDPERFDVSAGVDPSTRDRLTLLPDVEQVFTGTGYFLAVVDGYLFASDGDTLRFTADMVTWTPVTGTPAATQITGLVSDGHTVYVGYGAGGLWTVAHGASTATLYSTGTVGGVAYVKGRLLVQETSVSGSPRVYNVVASGGAVTAGTLLLTVPGGTFQPGQWATEGPSAIYIAAAVGDRTRIWRTSVKQDGTALDAPVIAGDLPDGQQALSIQGYLGSVVLVGASGVTDADASGHKVWVLGIADNAGNLNTLGHVDTAYPVLSFEPQDRFVWCGAGGALTRLDLSVNVATKPGDFVPGSAADLTSPWAPYGLYVPAVVTFAGRRVFTVSGAGAWVESVTDKVASGFVETGQITFGLGDLKNVLFADVRFERLADGDAVTVEVSKDGGPFALAGTLATPGTTSGTVSLGQLLCTTVNLRLTLAGDPAVTGLTVRAAPAPVIGRRWRFPLLAWRVVTLVTGGEATQDVPSLREFLHGLSRGRTKVTVQHGTTTFSGIVDRVAWTEETPALADDNSWVGWWNGKLDVDIDEVEQ